jgi:fructokinase
MIANIVSIGEVVWDIFPNGRVLGGAPLNVAYHLSCLGLTVTAVSRVGDDELGRSTKEHIKKLGLSVDGIQKDGALPTGQVQVTVGADNEPHFDIVAPAAWDNIAQEPLADLPDGGFSLVFGTLGQRDSRSRQTIRSLWPRAAYRFYDVNLRPPFTTRELVAESMNAADMVKVNVEELLTMGQWFGITATDKIEIAKELSMSYSLDTVVVTEGADGAWLLAGGDIYTAPAEPVQVADTVGAGDAFFATLIAGYLSKTPWQECLKTANKRGAYVASKNGATPPM